MPVEATGMSLIGIALAMLAWSPLQRLRFNQRCDGFENTGWELAPREGADNASPPARGEITDAVVLA